MAPTGSPLRSPFRSWMFDQIEETSASVAAQPLAAGGGGPDYSWRTERASGGSSDGSSSHIGELLTAVRKQHTDLRAKMGEADSPGGSAPLSPFMPSPALSDVLGDDGLPRASVHTHTSLLAEAAGAGAEPAQAGHRRLDLEQPPPLSDGAPAEVDTSFGLSGLAEPPWPGQPIPVPVGGAVGAAFALGPEPEPEPELEPRYLPSAVSLGNSSRYSATSIGAHGDAYSRDRSGYLDASRDVSQVKPWYSATSIRAHGDVYSRDGSGYLDASRDAPPVKPWYPATAPQSTAAAASPAAASPAASAPAGGEEALAPRYQPDDATVARVTAILGDLEHKANTQLTVIRCIQQWAASVALASSAEVGPAAADTAGASANCTAAAAASAEQEDEILAHSRRVTERARALVKCATATGTLPHPAVAAAVDADLVAEAYRAARTAEQQEAEELLDVPLADASVLVTAAKEHVARSNQMATDADAAWRAAASLLCKQIEGSMALSRSTSAAQDIATSPRWTLDGISS